MENQNKEVCATSYDGNTLKRIAIHNTKTHMVEFYNCSPIEFEEAGEMLK